MQLIDNDKGTVEEVTPAEKKKQDFSNVGDVIENLPDHSPQEKPVTSPTTKTGKPRGRPKKEIDVESLPKPADVKHFLDFLNIIFEHFKLEPLDKQELSEGVTSLFPIYKKFFPTIGGKSIYFAPFSWTAGVVISRIDYKKLFKKKDKDKKESDKQEQSKTPQTGIPDWSKSKQPGTH